MDGFHVTLGAGAYADVYKGRLDGNPVAVKRFRKYVLESQAPARNWNVDRVSNAKVRNGLVINVDIEYSLPLAHCSGDRNSALP